MSVRIFPKWEDVNESSTYNSHEKAMDILVLKPRISWYELEYELFMNHLQD